MKLLKLLMAVGMIVGLMAVARPNVETSYGCDDSLRLADAFEEREICSGGGRSLFTSNQITGEMFN